MALLMMSCTGNLPFVSSIREVIARAKVRVSLCGVLMRLRRAPDLSSIFNFFRSIEIDLTKIPERRNCCVIYKDVIRCLKESAEPTDISSDSQIQPLTASSCSIHAGTAVQECSALTF